MPLKFWNNIFNGKHVLFVTKSLRNTNTNLRQLAHMQKCMQDSVKRQVDTQVHLLSAEIAIKKDSLRENFDNISRAQGIRISLVEDKILKHVDELQDRMDSACDFNANTEKRLSVVEKEMYERGLRFGKSQILLREYLDDSIKNMKQMFTDAMDSMSKLKVQESINNIKKELIKSMDMAHERASRDLDNKMKVSHANLIEVAIEAKDDVRYLKREISDLNKRLMKLEPVKEEPAKQEVALVVAKKKPGRPKRNVDS